MSGVGIVPLMPPLLQAPEAGQKVELELRHYGNNEGSYALYDDDGESFAYEEGTCAWIDLQVQAGDDGPAGSVDGATPYTYGAMRWRFMSPDKA